MPIDKSRDEINIAESIVNRVLNLFDMTGNIEIRRRKEGTILDVQGCSNPGRLIGEDGVTLQALQHIVTLIVCRKIEQPTDIVIDVNGYRERRKAQLEDMAWRALDRVLRTGRSVILKPMSSSDRRIIHMTLSDEEDIETFSVDEDPDTGMKCVQIALRGEGDLVEDEPYPDDDNYDAEYEEEEFPDEDFEEPPEEEEEEEEEQQ